MMPKEFIQRDLFKPDTITYKPAMLNSGVSRRHHSIYNYGFRNPQGYGFRSSIDSNVIVTTSEGVENAKVGIDRIQTLDEYLNFRKIDIQSKLWDSTTKDYNLEKALSGGDLSRMIANSTGFSIPLPPNPIMSIFGSPKISLNVNGEVNVRVGWRWDRQNLGTVSRFGQTQSAPIFNQDIRLNVSGQIGDKLKINTDWNTRRSFDLNNTFKIGFEGEDDDIIKLVELGNVSLPTYNSLIGGGSTLFGIRADFQFGPLYLKTILSQRRGERRFVDVRGGNNLIPFEIRAYDYDRNYFFIDNEFKQVWREYYKSATPVLPVQFDSISVKEIEVWEQTVQPTNTRVREAVAHATLPKLRRGESYDPAIVDAQLQVGTVEVGRFQILDSTKWDFDFNLGVIRIENMSPDKAYAVSYRMQGPSQNGPADGSALDDDIRVGYLSNERSFDERMVLKLIYRQQMQPGFDTLWSRQMRNIYSISSSNIDAAKADINFLYIRQSNDSVDVLDGAAEKLPTILGVDRVDNAGQVQPDGQFDKRPPFFDARRGEIRFPSLEPFREGLIEYFDNIGKAQLANRYTFGEVYDTTYEIARLNSARDRFVIAGQVTGQSNSRINLGAFNLAPNSVRITLDGVELKEYQDYVVEYFSGTVQLRNPRAMLPNANLKIEYEQQDIFQVSTKTLAGVRADYQLFNTRRLKTNLGFNFMYYNQSAVIDQVTLGQEPVQNTMIGFDMQMNWDTPFVTKALDALPFYSTKAKSSFDVVVEWAMMIPEPNKRKSTIPSDDGESVVYIDNFEGVQRRITLGMTPTLWTYSSAPADTIIGSSGADRNDLRGRMVWYQKFIPNIPITDPYPNQQTVIGQSRIAPLEIEFDPRIRGIYNRNAEFVDRLNPNFDESEFNSFYNSIDSNGVVTNEKIWGGMMRLFSSFNTNFDTENIEFLELMLFIFQDVTEPNTKLYLDIGQISEDVIANGVINTEDGSTEANPLINGIVDNGEDLGLDNLSNEQERNPELSLEAYPFPLNLEEDPARDDYFFDFNKSVELQEDGDFVQYNNYEGNATQSQAGTFPDSEVLNLNNGQTVALDNSYFRYELDIGNLNPNTNPQIVGGNPERGWFLFRIPIRKPTTSVGTPLFSNIQYIRLAAQGGRFKGMLADWALVGSQWQRINNFQSNVAENDSVMQVSFVNVFDNSNAPDFYTLPPGVRAPQQFNSPNPQQDITLNEQSLKVCVSNLRYGEERMAIRIFNNMDLFYYKKLKFFIHGDGSMPISTQPGQTPQAYTFVRFGVDSANYYEYRQPITRDWDDIEIDLPQLTRIKQIRDNSRLNERQSFPVPGKEGATYAIKGTPILTRVQFFGIGIANPAERFPNDLTTCIWFNELRLTDAEDSNDWAALANATLKLADLGTINASFNRKEPNFHRLEERFGDRNNNNEFTITMQGNLEKFAPKSFRGMKVPITYTHAEILNTPEFVANSDINLEQAASLIKEQSIINGASEDEANRIADSVRRRSEFLSVQDSWALTGVKLGLPVKHWTINETFNKMVFSYNYNQQYERTQIVSNSFRWNWNANVTYSNNIPELLAFSPLKILEKVPALDIYSKWRINFLPSTIGWSFEFNRMRQTEQSRFLTFASPVIRNFTATRKANFTWNLTNGGFFNPKIDYSFNTQSSLLPLEFNPDGSQREGREIFNDMFFGDDIIDFGQNLNHNQTVTINFKPVFPDFAGMSRFLEMNGSYSSNYTWNDPLQPDPAIRDAAKNTNYNASLRFNIDFGLQKLTDKWWGIKSRNIRSKKKDTTSLGFFANMGRAFKFVFFDFENINIRFTQNNASTNPGVLGGNGMNNVWGRGLTGRASQSIYGPSFAYQMGLISNPHGGVNVGTSSAFPFITFDTYPGLRPANGRFQDNYRQGNDLSASTTRPLWKGATLDLNWKTNLTFNKNQTVLTDVNGVPTFTNVIATETFERSFISMPRVFGINLFSNTVEDVVELYEEAENDINNDPTILDSIDRNKRLNEALAQAFYEGLEAFSLSGTGRVGKFLPSLNWGIRWTGIEEWSIWDGYLKKVQVDHAYTSIYSESVNITDNGRAIQNQQVQSGFSPLIGITASFDEQKVGGTLTGSLRWNRTQGYNLNLAAKSIITSQVSNEIQLNASYTMDSFEFDLLGISLENNIEFSFLGSYKYNGRGTFDVFDQESFEGGDERGRVLDGSTVIAIEPRIRYSLTQRVTASFFVRYDGTFNEGAASPGFSTTQVGLDVRISIAGGR